MSADFFSSLNTVKKVLAADFACEESEFEEQGVFIRAAKELPGRRLFPFWEKAFAVASMGRGVVVSCSEARLERARMILGKMSRDDIFGASAVSLMDALVKPDNQHIAGPELKHICAQDIFRPYVPAGDIKITLVEDAKELEQYNESRFPNSMGYPNNPRRVAAVARCSGELAGIAGACADSDNMWQIGVDTLPEYRNRGIGKATVSAVTGYVLIQGIIPYYSTVVSNIDSSGICTALGYKPAWVELYARETKA